MKHHVSLLVAFAHRIGHCFCALMAVISVMAQPTCTVQYRDPGFSSIQISEHIDTSSAAANILKWRQREIIELDYQDPSATEIPPFILLLDSIEQLTLTLRSVPNEQFVALLNRRINTLDLVVDILDTIAFRGASSIRSIFLECPSVRNIDLSMVTGVSSLNLHGCSSLERLDVGPSVESLHISASGRDTLTQVVVRSQNQLRVLNELALVEFNGGVYLAGRQTEIGMLRVDMISWKTLCADTKAAEKVIHALSLVLLSDAKGCMPDIVLAVEESAGINCRYDRLSIEIRGGSSSNPSPR